MTLIRTCIFAFFLIFYILSSSTWFASKVFAQASVNVTTEDPVYRDIDKLVAHGLVKKIIVGQRPYSRREVARIIAEAMYYFDQSQEKFSEQRKHYIQTILFRLKQEYREELIQAKAVKGETAWYSLHPLEKASFDFTGVKSPARGFSPNGLGEIDASLNPLLQNRQGRHLVDGNNLSLETDHWFRLTNYAVLASQLRFQSAFLSDSTESDHGIYVNQLYGKFHIKNFELEMGRDFLLWGQGMDSGLLFSNNARGLDGFKISNDSPGYLPWIFKALGPAKATFFYADLGSEQHFPHSYLTGWKLSFQPYDFFEFGLANLVLSGGEGSPEGSLATRVGDVFPFVQLFSGHQVQIDNKIGGLDFRFRLLPIRRSEFYFEIIFDDTPGSDPKKFFIQDAGYLAGFYLPRVDELGKVDLRLEYRRTGIRYYRHPQFQSGWTLNRFILGDNLGPDAQGVYAQSRWDVDEQNQLGFGFAFEFRSNDLYEAFENDKGGLSFRKTLSVPKEARYRPMLSWQHYVRDFPLRLLTQFAYERVENFDFIEGNDRNNFMGRVQIEFNWDRWTRVQSYKDEKRAGLEPAPTKESVLDE